MVRIVVACVLGGGGLAGGPEGQVARELLTPLAPPPACTSLARDGTRASAAALPSTRTAAAEGGTRGGLCIGCSCAGCFCRTPLDLVLHYGTEEQVAETASCLLRAAAAVQQALRILQRYSHHSACLFADLMPAACLPLRQDQWLSIPAHCPDLARALPAVLQR